MIGRRQRDLLARLELGPKPVLLARACSGGEAVERLLRRGLIVKSANRTRRAGFVYITPLGRKWLAVARAAGARDRAAERYPAAAAAWESTRRKLAREAREMEERS